MNFLQKIFKTDTEKAVVNPTVEMLLRGEGSANASYIDISTRNQYAKVFSTISEVYSPITYSSKAFSNLKVKLFKTKSNGELKKEVTESNILTKLQQPNPLMGWNEFLQLYYINKKVFGNSYIYKFSGIGFNELEHSNLFVLPSQYIFTIPAAKIHFQGSKIDDFVKGYLFNNTYDLSKPVTFTTDKILHIKEPNICLNSGTKTATAEYLEGRSPLSTLSEPITNIAKAYDAQNVILRKRGALGLLSPKSGKDGTGSSVPMTKTERERLQNEFQLYGLGEDQYQIIISQYGMDWQAMSMPIKDLLLFEGIENSFKAICNTYNFNSLLLNDKEGATFNNVNEIKKSFYQDNIIPEAELFISSLNQFLGLEKENLKLVADFSHIPALQTDKKVEAEKDAINVNTIIQIQNSVFTGAMTVEAANEILINVLEFSPEMAAKIITKPEIIENVNDTDI
jgi:HK97 family phage portal protein